MGIEAIMEQLVEIGQNLIDAKADLVQAEAAYSIMNTKFQLEWTITACNMHMENLTKCPSRKKVANITEPSNFNPFWGASGSALTLAKDTVENWVREKNFPELLNLKNNVEALKVKVECLQIAYDMAMQEIAIEKIKLEAGLK